MSSQDENAVQVAEILAGMTTRSFAPREIPSSDRKITTSSQQANTSRRIVTAVARVNRQLSSHCPTFKQSTLPEDNLAHSNSSQTTTYSEKARRRLDIRTRRDPSQPPLHNVVHIVTESRKFYLIEELCKHESILFDLATQYLRPRDMLNLYCISKLFHFVVNHKLPSFVLASARRWADLTPHGQRGTGPNLRQHSYDRFDITTQLPFNAYRRLCVIDPSLRILSGTAGAARNRAVPSFRYLLFAVHRADIIKSICYQMALKGLRLPLDIAPSVLAKMGFVMDFATNAARIGLMHSPMYWTNNDLYVALMICVKLDLAFSDPIEGEDGRAEALVRQLMLAQRSLSTLNKVLRREKMRTQVELLRMWVEWKYIPQPEHMGMTIMGLPPQKIGHLQFEGWGLPPASAMAKITISESPVRYRAPKLLLRPDQLIVRESVRRGLNLETHLMDMLYWGYINPETMDDIENIGAHLLENPRDVAADATTNKHADDVSDDGTGWSKLRLVEAFK